jgi:hypothetical protein
MDLLKAESVCSTIGLMDTWRSVLKANPTDWLLEEDNPSVRYYTLIDLLDTPPGSEKVKKAKQAIMLTGVVPKILSRQDESGGWGEASKFYRDKYKGTAWQLLILAELGADGHDERIKKACTFVLEHSQDKESCGFSIDAAAAGGGRHSMVIPCLTGNMVFSLLRLGCEEDKRVRKGIEWIASYQRFDDGSDKAPAGWPFDRLEICWGKHTCHMGAAKSLKALAEIPAAKRSAGMKRVITNGAEYFLRHRIHKKSHNLAVVAKPGWLRFGFPLMYQTDILELLLLLTRLGYRDERMQEAIDIVVKKQDNLGRWKLENTFNGRMQVSIEQKQKSSKWITLNALRVLKNFYQ